MRSRSRNLKSFVSITCNHVKCSQKINTHDRQNFIKNKSNKMNKITKYRLKKEKNVIRNLIIRIIIHNLMFLMNLF